MSYLVGKQAYKLELPKKWKINNIFHILLLEQDITKKEWDKKVLELNTSNKKSRKYKIEIIWNSAIYAKESKDYLLKLYYLIE